MLVAYADAGSPAAMAGLGRGATVLAVDGVDFVNGRDVARTLNAGVFPTTSASTHTFWSSIPGADATHDDAGLRQ